MSNSSLVSHTHISPNSTNPRNHKIDTITIHHLAGDMTVEERGIFFANPERQASANYGVGTDGRIGLYVEEKNRPWTSGSRSNDHRAITIEVANDTREPDWHVSDKALEATIALCADICRRNGIEKLNYTGDTNGNLTLHKWFQATACPGPYLISRIPDIVKQVNERLQPEKTVYRIQTGAFRVKTYADNYLQAVRARGFADAYMVWAGGMYKIQVGAFENFDYAQAYIETVKEAGLDAFITTEQGQPLPTD